MARPQKCRRVCQLPSEQDYGPIHSSNKEEIQLFVDEYEVIRLIDYEGLSQSECSIQMGVARTTIQAIYAQARHKLACMLVQGDHLHIKGGHYHMCNGQHSPCKKTCYKNQINEQYQLDKGEQTMRIATTYENNMIYQHFGHTKQFKVYDIENNTVQSSQIVDTNGVGHGALADVLKAMNVDTLICGGIGGGSIQALKNANIQICAGNQGECDQAVEAYLKHEITTNETHTCHHHDENHHCHDHKHECHCHK